MNIAPGHLRSVRIRILVIAGIFLVLSGVIVWRYYILQIVRHQELKDKATRRVTGTRVIKNQRGRIFDFGGNLLVGNMPCVAVVCAPYDAVHEPFTHLEKSLRPGVRESLPARRDERRRLLARLLAENFNGTEDRYYEMLAPMRQRKDDKGRLMFEPDGQPVMRKNYFVRIAPRFEGGREVASAVSPEKVAAFKAALARNKLSSAGFSFENVFVRDYPKGGMLANVLGYANVGVDGTSALGGLEQTQSRYISEKERVVHYERNRSGTQLTYGASTIEEAGRDGDDIYLTIVEQIQSILEEELDAAMAEVPVESIYAVIVDPRTGNILALSQRPNFNPMDPKTVTNSALTARFAVNAYEPGSVMKPFTVGKAMDWGVVTPNTLIDCGSSRTWFYAGKPLSDFRGYGRMTPGGILKKSSNIGTAKIALMMGEDRVARMLRTFKFGVRTGLPFSSETAGQLPKTPFPDKLTVTRAPIGYSMQTSILQLARAYCGLASGGMMPELRLIDRRKKSQTGEIVRDPDRPRTQTFEHPAVVRDLVEMLISVTAPDGTGKQAAIPGYEVAGKTGTSRRLVKDPVTGKWGYGNVFCASFAGFVPARNPRFVMIISFDRVTGPRHGGGNVAAPVFRRTMSKVLRVMNVPPDFPEKLER